MQLKKKRYLHFNEEGLSHLSPSLSYIVSLGLHLSFGNSGVIMTIIYQIKNYQGYQTKYLNL